jgi:L-ascorbate metabolism protein UlaG (beta-lactamase superfamily)
MFEIEYKGGNCVIVSSKKTTITVDSNLSLLGLKDLKEKDAVELATEERFAANPADVRMVIESPGEYEVGDFTIKGVAAQRHIDVESDEKRSTMYKIESTEARIAVIGNIAPKVSDEQLEALGVVDVLVLPVGGNGYTLDATSAVSIVRQVEPKVVIPVHYADTALRYEVPQDTLDTFVKELGSPVETTNKFKVKSSTTLPTVLTVVELTRS